MKRKAFTLIEVMIVVLLIGILLSLAIPQFFTTRETTWRTSCEENRQKLFQARHMWIMDYEMDPAASPKMSDLVPEFIKRAPTCPTNGTYDLGSGVTPVVCSEHGS